MAGGGGGQEEINLVPYLDIMVNLIIFMIVVTAYIVELREAPVLVPAYNSTGSGATDGEQEKYLTVAISSKSFAILGSSDDIPADELVRDANGAYPYARLTETLRSYKTTYNLINNLQLVPLPQVPYDVLIHTMDAAREDRQGELFPGITLGVAVQ